MSLKDSKIMVDSSVWVEIIRGTDKGGRAIEFLVPREALTTSISIAEVERVLLRSGEGVKIGQVERLMEASCVDIDKTVAKRAARVSLEKNLGLADSLIAAASEINGCTLYTADKDFVGKGIRVVLLE